MAHHIFGSQALFTVIASVFLTGPQGLIAQRPSRWSRVQHIVGFEEASPTTEGFLAIDDGRLTFRSHTDVRNIPLSHIEAVNEGSESQETGGKIGKVARAAIPYGGGPALGLATKRTVGFLTIRYYDDRQGLHEALFTLPPADATAAVEALSGYIHPISTKQERTLDCRAAKASTIRLIPLSEQTIPPEYQAAVFEDLASGLKAKWPATTVLRGVDEVPNCRCPSVVLRLLTAKKGNAVTRTASGPVGLFVGVTKLRAAVVVNDILGNPLWTREFKASRRGDRESLGAASSMALSIAHAVERTHWDGSTTAPETQ